MSESRPSKLPAWLHRIRCSPNTVLAVVSLALVVDLLAYSIVVPALPNYMETKFGSSSAVISILFAAFAVAQLIATPIVGIVADMPSIGRRPPMIFGLLGLVGSSIFFGIGTELWMLFVARALQGVSAAATFSIGIAMIADVFPLDVLGAKMGVVTGVQGIGFIVGPTIGGIMYDTVGWLSLFILTASLVALDLLARVLLIDEEYLQQSIASTHAKNMAVIEADRARLRRTSQSTASATATADVVPAVGAIRPAPVAVAAAEKPASIEQHALDIDPLERQTSVIAQRTLTIWRMFLDHRMMAAISGGLFASLSIAALEPILPLWLAAEFGFDTLIIGLVFLALIGGYMIMSIVVGPLADRYRKLTIMAIGLCLLSISFPLLALTTTAWEMSLALFFVGACIAASITPSLPAISEHLQHIGQIHSQAQAYALFNIGFSSGQATGSLVSGVMYERLGFLLTSTIFAVISAVLALGLVAYCYFVPDEIAEAKAARLADAEEQAALTTTADTFDKSIAAEDEKVMMTDNLDFPSVQSLHTEHPPAAIV